MKKTTALVFLAMLLVGYSTFFFASQVQASEQPMFHRPPFSYPFIRLYDEQGHLRAEFVKGERIRIVTFFPSPVYLVKITDPDGKVIFCRIVISADCRHYAIFDSGLLSGLTTKTGAYDVVAGIHCRFKVRVFNVVPVNPLGVIGIAAACFAGFGLKYVRARKIQE